MKASKLMIKKNTCLLVCLWVRLGIFFFEGERIWLGGEK